MEGLPVIQAQLQKPGGLGLKRNPRSLLARPPLFHNYLEE